MPIQYFIIQFHFEVHTLINICPDSVCGFKYAYNTQTIDIIINEMNNVRKNRLVFECEESVSITYKSKLLSKLSVNN